MSDLVLIKQTAKFIKQRLSGEGSGHDWWHVWRVWQTAKTIAKTEKDADKTIIELGALSHDIADWKFTNGDLEVGPREARKLLKSLDVDEPRIVNIEDIIRSTSFKGAGEKLNFKTIEAKIVSDADKLDAIGAIGIARSFAYGGFKQRPIYEPNIKPTMHRNFEQYRNNESHTINHFYEKLLLLKDLMQTKKGKDMAQKRHNFMNQYLNEFFGEWEGKI